MVSHLYGKKKLTGTKRMFSRFSILFHWMEVVLALFVIGLVVIGAISIVQSGVYGSLTQGDFYSNFESILSDILLIVIGIELAILLIERRPESVVELMFFVVARRMLVSNHDPMGILLGVVAIAALFAVRKYLEHEAPTRQRLHIHDDKLLK